MRSNSSASIDDLHASGAFGVIYVAFGAPYLSMALVSMISLRVTNPGVPVCVVTNVVREPPANLPWWGKNDHWSFLDLETKENRSAKLRIYDLSPFEETLFLDCDTLILADIMPIRSYLEYFDISIKYVYAPLKKKRLPLLGGNFRYTEHGHFNSGVIAFRRNVVAAEFFDTWQQRFASLRSKYDQPSLVEAWFLSSAKIFPLPPFWNTGDKPFHLKARDQTVIWHYKTRLERELEQALSRAPTWFGANDQQIRDNDAFLALKRLQRHYRSPRWKMRSLITNIRGGLFRKLERHPRSNQWRAWIKGQDAVTPSPGVHNRM